MKAIRVIKVYVRLDWLKRHGLEVSDLESELYNYIIKKYDDPIES